MDNYTENYLFLLPVGTMVEITYNQGGGQVKTVTGSILHLDRAHSMIVLQTSSGLPQMLNTSLILGFNPLMNETAPAPNPTPAPVPIPIPTPAPAPKPVAPAPAAVPLYEQTPSDALNISDRDLNELYKTLPMADQKKLNSPYESFKHGIKDSNKSKMQEAALRAKRILLDEEDAGHDWSKQAVRLCGYMLRRVNHYDPEVYLVAECLTEAAYAAYKQKNYIMAGAYAIVAMLEEKPDIQDMLMILATGVVKGEDASALRLFSRQMPGEYECHLMTVIREGFAARGVRLSADMDRDKCLDMLESLYPKKEMGEEVDFWRQGQDAPAPQTEKTEAAPAVKAAEETASKPKTQTAPKARVVGKIVKLNWMVESGEIADLEGKGYTFSYKDFATEIRNRYKSLTNKDLNAENSYVEFTPEGETAKDIKRVTSLVRLAQSLMQNSEIKNPSTCAYELCRDAVDSTERPNALPLMMECVCKAAIENPDEERIKEALSLYERFRGAYSKYPMHIMNVARCYSLDGNFRKAIEQADRALKSANANIPSKERLTMIYYYISICRFWYEKEKKKEIQQTILDKCIQWETVYNSDKQADASNQKYLQNFIRPWYFIALCKLDRMEEAQEVYDQLSEKIIAKLNLDELLTELKDRLSPKEEEPQAEEALPEPAFEEPVSVMPWEEEEFEEPELSEEIEEEQDVPPYVDADGWPALGLTRKQVIDYALSITGPQRIPAILAYLRAGAELNKEILPVYRAVALAANDPMEAPDYSITALSNTLDNGDADYPALNDCCMGAAFLRASFLSGRGYDYSVQGLRDSISIRNEIPALREAYDTLGQFRGETGRAIDIYADYRNQGAKRLDGDIEALLRRVNEIYTRYFLNPPRERASIARVLETRKLIFDREGYFATMLLHIINREQDALDERRQEFIDTYLNGADQLSAAHISTAAVDAVVADAWEQAGKSMQIKRASATIQGSLRNNLRSNITEIITAICQWYALSEQSAGLSWRTEDGMAAYARLRPQLISQLDALYQACMTKLDMGEEPQRVTGLFLLAATAKELTARLDGSWKFDQERYLYADFLHTDFVMLNEDFMPELSSTFCVLPEFNILARIRSHVEGTKYTFPERMQQIFGREESGNNYGTARRIAEYLEFIGDEDAALLPQNMDEYREYTRIRIRGNYRSFLENYALAENQGKIIKSDRFCCTLEDTVGYWYAFCKQSENFGFFTCLLQQAVERIRISAKAYEEKLKKQLGALISGNERQFKDHVDYADAIQNQIENQNFTVAEDWMRRVRIGDFTLEVEQPEALRYLEEFWKNFGANINNVSDAGRTLDQCLVRRMARNKDTKGGQSLIDNWIRSGTTPTCGQIGQLLNLLGWQNILVSPYKFAADPRTQIFEVRTEHSAAGLTAPKHPIAAFGSALEKKPMHVVCLYGNYDYKRLYEKIRMLDSISGSKIILLDYALVGVDRRTLAKKLKNRESGLRNTYMVIDRVLITHLSNNYNENLINRILMAISMPFSYYQPYVPDSANTMPPEIFIGRKDELLRIKEPNGVNLIYGGRQLGKSALFKKALADLDGRDGQRAVLVDIKELDCRAAAKKVSTKLIDLGITPDAEITEDWDTLCRNVERQLRGNGDKITYFLLMLDEADTFISDCANCGYRPLAALKDLQQSLPDQFKYVLAGLHNVIRFNRQVSLGNNSVITHMTSLKITPFGSSEAQELLTGPLSYLGFSLPNSEIVSQILATCNYFPGLIQLFAKNLIESVRATDYAGYDVGKTPPYVVTDEHLSRVLADKEFKDQIRQKFEATLMVDADQGNWYYPLTLLIGWMYNVEPSEKGYTAQDVLRHAKDLHLYPLADLKVEQVDALMLELFDLNILRDVRDGVYLLASKNFRDLLGTDEDIFNKLTEFGGGEG